MDPSKMQLILEATGVLDAHPHTCACSTSSAVGSSGRVPEVAARGGLTFFPLPGDRAESSRPLLLLLLLELISDTDRLQELMLRDMLRASSSSEARSTITIAAFFDSRWHHHQPSKTRSCRCR